MLSSRLRVPIASYLSRAMTTTSIRRSRPANWKAAAPEPLPGTLTFGGQTKLSKLPLPTVEDTLSRLKETLRPIALSEEELQVAFERIDDFAGSQAPELHRLLLERVKQRPHWLEEWWDDVGYLGYRDSVVINVSYYYGFDESPSHLPSTAVSRAASITRAAMIFRQQLKQGLIKPDSTREGPLCMDTYRWMFDCSRVPGDGLDWSVSYAKPGDTGDLGHIVVIRNNRVWKVDVTDNGRILSTKEIERQLQHIIDATTQIYPGVGVLAASNRDVWSKDYAKLSSDPINAKILEVIHSSAFVVSLDSSQPSDPVHHSRALWHGDIVNGIPTGLQNRWVDKPVQFIVFDNGRAGIMGEHSVMDGTPTARMCDDVLDMLYDPAFDHGVPPSASESLIPQPLDWRITSTTAQAIDIANKAAVELIESQELGYYLTTYGKGAIKKFGVSPDSWAQMIVQLAYRRLIGPHTDRQGGTYEAATTRKFYKGRTEAIRVVSSESDAWVRSMDDATATPELRKSLFDEATKKHISLAKAAGQGQGVDRHMLGLKMVWKETMDKSLPAIFSDPVYLNSSRWILSTSAIFSKHFPVYGWGEVDHDGFGVAYMTGYDDRLQYTITSRKEMPNDRFIKEIARAADDLYALHQQVAGLHSRL